MTTSFQSAERPIALPLRGATIFGLSSMLFVLISGIVAGIAPIAFSVTTVFLFAAPHNWMELRYCLSRLPSKVGPLKTFFVLSSIGLTLLFLSYVALVVSARTGMLTASSGMTLLSLWNMGLIGWCVALALAKWPAVRARSIAIACGAVLLALSLSNPRWFSLLLVYAHPLVGLLMLDRELVRSRRSWLAAYRWSLCSVPFVVSGLVLYLAPSASIAESTQLDTQIIRHAGGSILPDVSSHLLVSVHTFLEMLHYGAWCLAIPLAARMSFRNTAEKVAVLRNRPLAKKFACALLALSSLAVCSFWTAFSFNYAFTRDFYFILAMVHVLGEIPLLMWMFPGRQNPASLERIAAV